jgi:diguanylate cyclase (GGDEF)-like protein
MAPAAAACDRSRLGFVAVRTTGPPVNVLAVGFEAGDVEGASVETVDDLLGALARLADEGVDVVLLALDLTDAEGADAVRSIRERAPEVPVIGVLTGDEDPSAGSGLAERAVDAGASDVIPSGSGELLARAVRYATSLRRMEEELARHQVVDEVTGLYNARGLEQLGSHHLALAKRSKRPVTLVFVRLDALDEDDAGERRRLVLQTAEILRDAVRSSDVLARVGPGSFCVLLTGDSSGAESTVLSRLVEAIAESNARSGRTSQLSVSVGAAEYDPEHPVSLDALIARADDRMRRDRDES